MQLVDGERGDITVDFRWPDQRSDEFLRRAAGVVGFDLNPCLVFGKQEVRAARFLKLCCRKVVPDSNADFQRMRKEIDALPWMGEDPYRRFRLPNRLFLSRINLRPNQIGVGARQKGPRARLGEGKVVQVEVSGDLGYIWNSYRLTATPKAGGQRIQAEGKSVLIVRRQQDNSWKIALLMDNSDHGQPAST
jgi:hypothetical protein